LEKYQDYEEQIVMSGPELFQLIRERQLADTEKIRNAYLAYQTTITDKYVDLNPVWVVEVENNPTLYVPARTGQGGGDADGLE
jgi:regulatory protein YycH of two-component signal transduction system YycFG